MAAIYTIDASVFVNAFNPSEPGHEDSHRLLAWLRREAVPIVVPTLLLPEVAAAVARGRGDEDLARRFATTVRRLPHVTLVPLDESLAKRAVEVAARFRLRGSDAVYASLALRFGSVLVTLDQQQRERVAVALPTQQPAEVLEQIL